MPSTSGLAAGSLVSGPAHLQSGTQIARILSATQIAITEPTTGNFSGASLTFTPNNGGTIFKETGSGHCVVKVNYGGDPHEFGAYGDGTHDDANALLSWLASPGPWDAAIPATYMTGQALTCWPNIHLRSPANDSRENSGGPNNHPLVQITVAGTTFPTNGTAAAPIAVITADALCRISGLSIDANDSHCSDATNCYVDAVNVVDNGAIVDEHSLLQHGYFNLYCAGGSAAGLQLKDSQYDESYNDNIHIAQCANARVIGDIVSLAGTVAGAQKDPTAIGLYYQGEDVTISNSNVEQSQGIGIDLYSATLASVAGTFVEKSGLGGAGAGLEIDGGAHISVCGNHFKQNDGTSTTSAHVRFNVDGSNNSPNDVSFCGNVYVKALSVPAYVYDVLGSTSVLDITLYENPVGQTTGVSSSAALVNSSTGHQVCPPAGCPAP
jgi:hypothetical protein